jgi:C1A family cysteine protease
MVNGRRLNYKFETNKNHTPNQRYRIIMDKYRKTLPSLVDLRPGCSPVENQGDEGSCSGHATAGGVEFLEIKEKSEGPQVYDPNTFERVSRNFIYYGERDIEGSIMQDDGATTLRDACKVLMGEGVCRETLWPYDAATLFTKPSAEAYADAAKHKLDNYYALNSGYELKHCLFSGFPFMFGFQVFESFMGPDIAANGLMPMPAADEQIVGGHAVLCVGYDDARGCFIVRNSWGNAWGIDGYFHMPYEFMDSQYTDDYYTLRLSPTNNP